MQGLAQILLLLGMVVLIWMFLSLRSYINKKAENLAQKEDLETLTDVVERVRAQFDKANLVHRVQFEAEFRSYQDLWRAANEVEKRFVILNSLQFPGSRTEKNFRAFVKAQLAFADVFEGCKPFIPLDVWKAFRAFEDIMIDDKMMGTVSQIPAGEFQKYRETARLAGEECGEAIKRRLASLLVV